MNRLLLLLALLLPGCGASEAAINAATPPANTVTVRYDQPVTLGRTAVDFPYQVRYLVRDGNGQAVFGPVVFQPAPAHTLSGVPGHGVTLEVELLDATGQGRGEFTTQVDLEDGTHTVQDPGLVATESSDPTVYTFVTFGCNRVQQGDIQASVPSTANAAQLTQDFAELVQLTPRPAFLIFTGDLVVNEMPGGQILEQQLIAWKQFYQASVLPGSGIVLVPMTGNHEVLVKNADGSETPNPDTLPVWLAQMGAFLRGNDGPTTAAPNLDGLTFDQSQFSYTFKDGDIAYVVLNTDTFIDATTAGDVPLNWLQGQLNALNADPTVNHIFLFGHKPVHSPDGEEDGIRELEEQPFVDLLNGSPKVRAYLCAHAHLWTTFKLGNVPQVIAGNGGSQAEKKFRKKGYYGYTLVKRKRSGSFHVESYGRPIPDPYDSSDPQPASTRREKFSIDG
ncbi:MAG: metallophosphoesterase [Candidatus Eremiobacterota bacterium]